MSNELISIDVLIKDMISILSTLAKSLDFHKASADALRYTTRQGEYAHHLDQYNIALIKFNRLIDLLDDYLDMREKE